MTRSTRARAWLLLPLAFILSITVYASALTNIHRAPALPTPSLSELAAKHDVALGNFAIPSRLDEPAYRTILTSQFGFALIDNQPNWHFTDADLRPTATTYNFTKIDQVLNFAEQAHMPVQVHHFIWGEEKWLPDWLKSTPYSKTQLLGLMHDHILTVGHHYSGRVQSWTVVNEAFTRNQHINGLHDWWADHLGGTAYIDDAFRWARQADPHAQLILNDFGNETANSVSDAMYNYIKDARARGVPIDGIGMQMHIDGTKPPSKQAVIANMQRFAALGVDVYVTEFDVNMNDVTASTAEKYQREGRIYHDMMRACIESKVCHSFAILGITDKETWYNYLPVPEAIPLLFDEQYHPKPAYYQLRRALMEP